MTEKNTQSHPLARLLNYMRPHRMRVNLAILFSILNKVFDLAPPALIGVAVEIVVNREESYFARWGVADPANQLIVLAIITLVVWILESAFEYANRVYWRNLAQNVEHELRIEAYSHVQDLELAYFEECESQSSAMQREGELKQKTHSEKRKMIEIFQSDNTKSIQT